MKVTKISGLMFALLAASALVFGGQADAAKPPVRKFVVPLFTETPGTTSTTQNNFDTDLYFTWASGVVGKQRGTGAVIDLYLFDLSSAPLAPAGPDVCNPCTFSLDSLHRRVTARFDDLIKAAGGYGSSMISTGWALLVVRGSNPVSVNIAGVIVNSHTSPFDVSLTEFTPQPLH